MDTTKPRDTIGTAESTTIPNIHPIYAASNSNEMPSTGHAAMNVHSASCPTCACPTCASSRTPAGNPNNMALVPNTQSTFLSIAGEIRNTIVELGSTTEPSKNMDVDCRSKYTIAPRNLLDSCKQLRTECAGLYYASNTFIIPLCGFARWVEDMDCKVFPLIRKIRITLICKDITCTECSIPTNKGARQCRDFLPLLKFAITYPESRFTFAVPLLRVVFEERSYPYQTINLGRTRPYDFSTAKNWYECLFTWADRPNRGGYPRIGASGRGMRTQLGRAMEVYSERFEAMCKDENILRNMEDEEVRGIGVDVLCAVRSLDLGGGILRCKEIKTIEFREWIG